MENLKEKESQEENVKKPIFQERYRIYKTGTECLKNKF